MKSIQAEDNGTYICAIKQPRGSEPSIEKSQSINVIVVGKRKEKISLLRRAKSSIKDRKLPSSYCI